ncbi:hypothetical protein FT663_01298 [Candidozyma haemuli var. vulneris]|uniref:AN1-type domain-containing protein n=1 Tax=Candidozyma haemuli TaxID=45357 RepID=A0A2V1AWD3_9ASCO|nr:hypothetical protein CXQ85_004975 [[Candida] haemuloni]KAF3992163.1 hypothetical protein FT662_01333 [[Candida] haemuloni var. vulneris]KAF3994608.1 hypothetical protein FT663_01298 [[Candida] haemuloni var. vulneris]PVH22407.1 hypothetical protein CXQ85_004975 [[Candida] haemuloni]
MKITFRLSTELSYTVTVPDNSTVEDLANAAKVGCPPETSLPSDFKLIYNGSRLAPFYKPLETFNLVPSNSHNTVILMNAADAPEATPAPAKTPATSTKKKSKKNRCSFSSCTSVALRMVGDCGHCNGKFCAKHRLLEDHSCTGLQYCKDDAHERNAMKLQSESTIASRV